MTARSHGIEASQSKLREKEKEGIWTFKVRAHLCLGLLLLLDMKVIKNSKQKKRRAIRRYYKSDMYTLTLCADKASHIAALNMNNGILLCASSKNV